MVRALFYGVLLTLLTIVVPPFLRRTPALITQLSAPVAQQDLLIENNTQDISINPDTLFEMINQYRVAESHPALAFSDELCPVAQAALDLTEQDASLSPAIKLCPNCRFTATLSVRGTYSESDILESFQRDDRQTLLEDASSICIRKSMDTVAIAIGILGDGASGTSERPPTLRDIPDTEVVAAINAYRASHSSPQLVVNDHLCAYAQKRAGDLVTNGGLDAHAGFRADFADGKYPPQLEGYTGGRVGENLAHQYCYRGSKNVVANTGTALIEWCFDSSTDGHREAQLDPKYTAVCVRHAQNMYVVIFGE